MYDFMNNAPEGTITGCRWWVAPSATGTRIAGVRTSESFIYIIHKGKVDIPASTLQSDLKQMFNNTLSSDVQLTVEDYSGNYFASELYLQERRRKQNKQKTK